MAKPIIFISYSHRDERWKRLLVQHLDALERQDCLEVWCDDRLRAGDNWYEAIELALQEARVAVLLVSVDFLTSEFILGEEVPSLLRRRVQEGLKLVPVIVRSCPWKRVRWLQEFVVRPSDGRALASFKGTENKEAEIVTIVEEILRHVDEKKPAQQDFLTSYRRAFSPLYSRWDLASAGVTQWGGAGRPIDAQLDQMFLRLRLDEKYNPSITEKGSYFSPVDLVKRDRPLVIRGSGGTGKTTLLRWTFRRLLEPSLESLPLMLVLRDLAARWKDRSCHGPERSLDVFLEGWIAQQMSGWAGSLGQQLEASTGPRPILLVDGWDEVGPLGEELRQKLIGFLRRYPRVLAVVTSRPYGEGRPSHSDGFDVFDIQPLSDSDIQLLTSRFFVHCYGTDPVAAEQEAMRFSRSLARAPEPQALARTALLLTMMLLIARSRPLPDKRHLLYQACIENLLTALPDRKEEEGGLPLREQWHPQDSELRMRLVAELAFRMKSDASTRSQRASYQSAIVCTWDVMSSLLPEGWPDSRRMGFLSWLAGPAGLLTDRTDGTLCFAHLSFQEYLVAWHLDASVEGIERVATFQRLVEDQGWWETLRLWAALIERQSPARLDSVIEEILGGDHDCLAFLGCLFADGLGDDPAFSIWTEKLVGHLSWRSTEGLDLCSWAWRASQQIQRKARMATAMAPAALKASWHGWFRLFDFHRSADLETPLPAPQSSLYRIAIQKATSSRSPYSADSADLVAASRLHGGDSTLWPTHSTAISLLNTWPSLRRTASARIQVAVAAGASREALRRIARFSFGCLRSQVDPNPEIVEPLCKSVNAFIQRMRNNPAHQYSSYAAKEVWISWQRDWAGLLPAHLPENFFRTWQFDSSPRIFLDKIKSILTKYGENLMRDWCQALGLEPEEPWVEQFFLSEHGLQGRYATRARVAALNYDRESLCSPLNIGLRKDKSKEVHAGPSKVSVMAEACRLSLGATMDPVPFERALSLYGDGLDPLWPALARHLAHRSQEEDRALLRALAQNPALREPPLRFGLQFIVRGDVMLNDGTTVTLDEFAEELQIPSLSYLDEAPKVTPMDQDTDS